MPWSSQWSLSFWLSNQYPKRTEGSKKKVSEERWAVKLMFDFVKELSVVRLQFWIEWHNNFYGILAFETW
jgi:hypothetical protein